MNDVRVITEKIISDAQALAAEKIRRAEGRAELIYGEYEARAKEQYDDFEESARTEREDALNRAESTVRNAKKGATLSAKGRALDAVFSKVKERFFEMSADEYLSFMSLMLKGVLKSAVEEERVLLAGDEYGEIAVTDRFTLLLAEKDMSLEGELVALSKKCLEGEEKTLSAASSDRVSDGGFILVCRDISIDCTLSSLLAGIRKETEHEVLTMLFDESERG